MQRALAGALFAAALTGSAATAASDALPAAAADQAAADPNLWLEDVQGERALAWVRARNAESQAALSARPDFAPTKAALLQVLDAKDRIPYVQRMGDWFYNFWQDADHKRGIWRRTTLAEYLRPEPAWETVLDLDALGAAEKQNWVLGSASCLAPAYERCLISLSRGGADAKLVREFDLKTKRFVGDGGFTLPEAKSEVAWIDANAIYVGTDFGPGSLTDSGYPRVIKRWLRGTPLAKAQTVFEGQRGDVSVSVSVDRAREHPRTVFSRAPDFFSEESFLQQGGRLVKVAKPADAQLAFRGPWLLLSLRSDWKLPDGKTFAAGSLLAADAKAYLKPGGERALQAVFTPSATRSLQGYTATRSMLLLDVLDKVASRVEEVRYDKSSDSWRSRSVNVPFPGQIGISSLHDDTLTDDALAERYWFSYTDFLTPDSLYLAETGSDARLRVKSRPPQFRSEGMRVEQRFATSRDGTSIPYFVIWPKGSQADGTNPTLLYGYGGFEIPLLPQYSGGIGRAWLERGGVRVVANIRGGGEFGPVWHQAAVKANKQRSYDDFIAVAEDLIRSKITTPQHLGIQGGSNGGLLVCAVAMQRPELFRAVVCQVPLLDMRRYSKLLAGASWMAEYGNPDLPEEWAYISRYSPYQNVRKEAQYPTMLFTTSTRDDRVHPGHARKMVARMMEQGHPVLYYENIEGGHGGAADNAQRAYLQALEFTYLWERLGGATP